MQKDTAIRLLIVDDRVEDAEAIVSTLRNGGIAVRPLRPQNAAELAQMLAAQPIDLAVAADATSMPLEQVRTQVAASGKDLPLLQLVDRIDEAAVLASLGGAARALVLKHRPEHLLETVRREWADLEARRSLRRRAERPPSDARLQSFVRFDPSGGPVPMPAQGAARPRQESRPHPAQGLDHPAHRPRAQRRVAGEEAGEAVTGEQAHQQAGTSAGIAHVEHVRGLGEATHADTPDAPAPRAGALQLHAHGAQSTGGGGGW